MCVLPSLEPSCPRNPAVDAPHAAGLGAVRKPHGPSPRFEATLRSVRPQAKGAPLRDLAWDVAQQRPVSVHAVVRRRERRRACQRIMNSVQRYPVLLAGRSRRTRARRLAEGRLGPRLVRGIATRGRRQKQAGGGRRERRGWSPQHSLRPPPRRLELNSNH